MSISSISGSQAAALFLPSTPGAASAGNTMAVLASVGTGSDDGALIANLDVASSGVSSALESLSSALGSIINTTA